MPQRPILLPSLLCAMLLSACATGPAPAIPRQPRTPEAPRPDWTAVAPMRHARNAHAVVTDGTSIWALAGTGVGGPVLDVERFDGRAWHVETQLPGEGLNAPAAVLHAGRIYVFGGFHGVSNLPGAEVHVYDVRTRTWSRAAPQPAPRGGHAAAVLDGRIHLVGGGNDRSTLSDHTVYDPATDTWTALAPLPRDRGSPAAVVHQGRLWIVGGRSGRSDFGLVDVFDAAADRWTSGPDLEPRGTHGAVVYRGALHVFGGESQALGRSLATVLRLGVDGWDDAPPMPTARNYARAVVAGDAVYVVGGSPDAGNSHGAVGSNMVERYQPAAR